MTIGRERRMGSEISYCITWSIPPIEKKNQDHPRPLSVPLSTSRLVSVSYLSPHNSLCAQLQTAIVSFSLKITEGCTLKVELRFGGNQEVFGRLLATLVCLSCPGIHWYSWVGLETSLALGKQTDNWRKDRVPWMLTRGRDWWQSLTLIILASRLPREL